MEIGILKINDLVPMGVYDIGIMNVPFFGDAPIKATFPCRDFMHGELGKVTF
jgi:hypothetical protein